MKVSLDEESSGSGCSDQNYSEDSEISLYDLRHETMHGYENAQPYLQDISYCPIWLL